MKKISISMAAALTFSLGACGGGGSDPEPTEAIEVITVSGKTINLGGTWSGCQNRTSSLPGNIVSLSEKVVWVFSGTNVTISEIEYAEPDCTGTILGDVFTADASITTGVTATTAGWSSYQLVNGIFSRPAVSPPLAADSSGPLTDHEPVTLLEFLITDHSVEPDFIGETESYFFVVDDTATVPIFYEKDFDYLENNVFVDMFVDIDEKYSRE